MKKLTIPSLLLPLLAVTAHAQAHAQVWNVMQDLGDFTSSRMGYAFVISADGSVVAGWATFGSTWMYHAFRWTSDGGMQDLGDLTPSGTGQQSQVTAVSADGSVLVGWANYSPIVSHAFRWTSAGGMQSLGDLRGGTGRSLASAVSADGSVVVGEASAKQGSYRAFRWTSEGGMQDLGDLTATGTGWSSANAVSADGSVVAGRAAYDADRYHAFRWTSEGGMQGLGDLTANNTGKSQVNAISADGNVLVGEASYGSATKYHAFRWTSGAGMQDLGDLTANGTGGSQAHAVSTDGRVVVGQADYGSGTKHHAFRWTSDGGLQGLGDFTAHSTGSSKAWAVSADGSVVVGQADYAAGSSKYHAFLWTSEGGMQDLGDFTTNGTGLSVASAVSADGLTVVGHASNDQGLTRAFIYRTRMQDLSNVQTSLPKLAADKELAAAQQQMRMARLLQTQCATGKPGVSCLKVTGSFDAVGADAGIGLRQQTQGVVTLGYGLSEQWTWGGNLLLGHASLRHSAVDPDSTYGLSGWLAYSQSGQAGNGWQIQAAVGYSQQNNTITRGQGLSNVELVSGTASLNALAARVAVGFGISHSSGWLITPQVALTQHHSKLAAYDEAKGDFRASYQSASLKATVLTLGVAAQKAMSQKTQLRWMAGVEQDLNVGRMKFSGISDMPGAEVFNMQSALSRKALRPYATAGYVYLLDAASAVAADIGVERDAFSSKFNMGLSVSYSKIF
nr:autotransporter domain-containing protein [uncultured Comamonas sp.]